MVNLAVDFCGVTLKNPVTTASGTFGSGMEYGEFFDLSRLGAVTTKGVANVPWEGNPTPRVAETPSGMLNAIGLQNPGIDVFLERDLPYLAKYDTKVIVNVCGHAEEEYVEVVEKLADAPADLLEINISCPNVKAGGIAFGTDPKAVEAITRAVKAKEAGGADAISLINTLTGMKIDVERRRFLLANRTGGLSGPAIHPIAVRMVYEASHAVGIPVLGMGGVRTAEDAIELMMAGAAVVAVGTANFHDPLAAAKVVDGIREFCVKHEIRDVRDIIGCV